MFLLNLLVSQPLGICFNLRSFFLIVLSYYTGIDAVVEAGDDTKADGWGKAMPYFLPGVILIGCWTISFMAWSGVLQYRIDQLGFHVMFVNGRKTDWYKKFAYATASYLSIAALLGMAQHPAVAQQILTMLFTVSIALFDVYSPLVETVVYKSTDGFDVLSTSIKGQLLAITDSSKITEMFQDAVLSALKGDFSHLKALTDLDDDGIKQLLNHVHSTPKQEIDMLDCCGCRPFDKPDAPKGGDDLEMANSPTRSLGL
jgi:hypothetical protein